MELPINVRENILLRSNRNTILNTCNSDSNWQRYCITDTNLKLWETLIRRDLPVLNNVNLQYYLSREGINTGTKLGDYIQLYKQGIKFGYSTFIIGRSRIHGGLQVLYILPSGKLFIRLGDSNQDRVIEYNSKVIKIEHNNITTLLLLEDGTVWYGKFGSHLVSDNNWDDMNFNLSLTNVIDISLTDNNFCILFKDGTMTYYNVDGERITELRKFPGPILSCKAWLNSLYLFDTNNNLSIYGQTRLPTIEDKVKNDIIAMSGGTITKIDDTPIGFCPSYNIPFAYIKQGYRMIRGLYRNSNNYELIIGDKDIAAYTPLPMPGLYQDILLYTDGSIQKRIGSHKSYFQLDGGEKAIELQHTFFRTNKNKVYEYDLSMGKQFSTMLLPEGIEIYFY